MHENTVLGGPVWWALVAFIIVATLLALFVVVDAARRNLRGDPLRWGYVLPSVGYLALLLLAQLGLAPAIGGVAALLTLPMVALGIVYLLRVAFPKPPGAGNTQSTEVHGGDSDLP